jgi:hypothetical protein
VKIYVTAVEEALRKNEGQDGTQFITKYLMGLIRSEYT